MSLVMKTVSELSCQRQSYVLHHYSQCNCKQLTIHALNELFLAWFHSK